MVIGTTIVAIGYFFTHVESFAQFAAIRLTLVSLGDSMMGYMVVNVIIAQWFMRQRSRALAFSSMGVGFAKVCMPVLAAWLILTLGWRQTWLVFGFMTLLLLVVPALLVIRRSPESMGLLPDGATEKVDAARVNSTQDLGLAEIGAQEALWTRAEAVRTSAFWLLVITFGISSMGVTGLNLHVYSYVTDVGYSPVIAATVMSIIASMQLASPLVWGVLADQIGARYAATLRFVIQAIGLAIAILMGNMFCLYLGFFLYGIGLGGNMVLPDTLWAGYFGRRSLGKIRGMGLLVSQVLAAMGPPFSVSSILQAATVVLRIFGGADNLRAVESDGEAAAAANSEYWSDGVMEYWVSDPGCSVLEFPSCLLLPAFVC
jgi:MFS family permease